MRKFEYKIFYHNHTPELVLQNFSARIERKREVQNQPRRRRNEEYFQHQQNKGANTRTVRCSKHLYKFKGSVTLETIKMYLRSNFNKTIFKKIIKNYLRNKFYYILCHQRNLHDLKTRRLLRMSNEEKKLSTLASKAENN